MVCTLFYFYFYFFLQNWNVWVCTLSSIPLYLTISSEQILTSRKISVAPPQRLRLGDESSLPFAAPVKQPIGAPSRIRIEEEDEWEDVDDDEEQSEGTNNQGE
jgi:hypothetical protein